MQKPETTREPTQERSRKTRAAILEAALEILETTGFEKLSTNQIAKVAGINIATLYRYFSDKYEILSELAIGFSEKQSDLICSYLKSASIEASIEEICNGMVDALVDGTKNDRALVQLQRALTVYPELQKIYRGSNREIGVAMRPFLREWGIEMNDRQRNLAMTCLGEAFGALQDLALSNSSTYNSEVIEELKTLLAGYYEKQSATHR